MSSSSAYHSARSSVSSSPTLANASLPVNSSQTLVDEPTIIVDSDDDDKSNDGLDRSDDDEVDDLATRLGLTTLYTVNETQTTPYW